MLQNNVPREVKDRSKVQHRVLKKVKLIIKETKTGAYDDYG